MEFSFSKFSRTYATNVRCVHLRHPLKFNGWITKQKKSTYILESTNRSMFTFSYERTILKITSFRRFDSLKNYLFPFTYNKNFIDVICDWLRGSNFKMLEIRNRGEYFYNIEDLKNIEKIKISYNMLNKYK